MSILEQLAARKAQLQAQATELNERLERCQWAIAVADEAQQRRSALLDQHDRTVADAIAYGNRPPDVDPALNLAEIALRKASGEARGALRARERITDELQRIHVEQGALALQLEEQTWSDADAATAHLFEEAETDTAALRRSLARIQSVSRHAYEQAHSQSNGREPTQHPAFRFWLRNEARIAQVRALGAIEPDYETGPQLLADVAQGKAPLGDISRWTVESTALPDGSGHLNRPLPGQETVPAAEPALHNPATHPDEAWWERQGPQWASPFMPSKRVVE
jgi:hypothetical protein